MNQNNSSTMKQIKPVLFTTLILSQAASFAYLLMYQPHILKLLLAGIGIVVLGIVLFVAFSSQNNQPVVAQSIPPKRQSNPIPKKVASKTKAAIKKKLEEVPVPEVPQIKKGEKWWD